MKIASSVGKSGVGRTTAAGTKEECRAKFERTEPKQPPLCVDCRHYRNYGLMEGHCFKVARMDFVTGGRTTDSANLRRSLDSHCGHQARDFEPIQKPEPSPPFLTRVFTLFKVKS